MKSSLKLLGRSAAILAVCMLLVHPAAAADKRDDKKIEFNDETVQKAIDKGAKYLWSKQQSDGSWKATTEGKGVADVDMTALCAYALLESGFPPSDKRIRKTLEYIAAHKSISVYGLGLRCCAWAAAARHDKRFLKLLEEDVKYLVHSIRRDGAYEYKCTGRPLPARRPKSDTWSNSRTQYGVLGVWMGVINGVEVPRGYWELSLKHWLSEQKKDGGFGYNRAHDDYSTVSMTVAGLASLYLCTDNLYASRFVRCSGNNNIPAIDKALDYIGKNFEKSLEHSTQKRNWIHYTLYGIERVALASGMRYFGKHDWYREGGRKLLEIQSSSGAWSKPSTFGSLTSTGYALLFLVRGQKPVLVNKLKFPGDWNNRPRDMANLTRWLSNAFEATLNWQVIDIDLPVHEWHDAPILYMSAEKALELSDEQINKLRTYVEQGGTILSVAECSGRRYTKSVQDMCKTLFPDYPLTPVPDDHPLQNVHFKSGRRWPKLEIVSNGLRSLLIHCDEDLAKSWQLDASNTKRDDFEAIANIAMYLTDKKFRHRGTSTWPQPPTKKAAHRVKVVRLRLGDSWNPEPQALERLSRLMQEETGVALEQLPPVAAEELTGSGASVAFLTGMNKVELTTDQKAALKAFVEGGGTLCIDVAGGSADIGRDFAGSMSGALDEIFDSRVRSLPADSKIYTPKGRVISKVEYRPVTSRKLGGKSGPNLQGLAADDGRVSLVFSNEDIVSGLAGSNTYGLDGYTPDAAYAIARNVVMQYAPEKKDDKSKTK